MPRRFLEAASFRESKSCGSDFFIKPCLALGQLGALLPHRASGLAQPLPVGRARRFPLSTASAGFYAHQDSILEFCRNARQRLEAMRSARVSETVAPARDLVARPGRPKRRHQAKTQMDVIDTMDCWLERARPSQPTVTTGG